MSKKTEIARVFKQLYEKLGREPSMAELREYGVTRKLVRYHFQSKEQLSRHVLGGDSIGADKVVSAAVEEENDPIVIDEVKRDFSEEKKEFIIQTYLDILSNNKRFPVYADFIPYGVTAGVISSMFGGIAKLQEYVVKNHEEHVRENFTTLDAIVNSIKSENGLEYIGKRYVVTTAVANFKAHSGFISALKNYSDKRDAQLMILPCESITNSFENKSAVFDMAFGELAANFITSDTKLNENLFLCSIQVSAKQIKATTGLARLGKRGGSYIFASPKQFLDYRPSGSNRGNNYSIMTTGSCTTGDYFANNLFVSKRLSYIADNDHMLGAIVVEIEDDKHFHFRQIQASEDGSFIDLGVKYNPDGSTENVKMNIILGDLHGIQVDEDAINSFVDDFKDFDIENVFIHDLFDGNSVSHHIGTIVERHDRASSNNHILEKELSDTFNVLKDLDDSLQPEGKIYVVKSNHDEFLTRYLKEGRYVNDPQNHYLSLKIAIDMLDGMDVIQSGFVNALAYDSDACLFLSEKVEFLERDVSVIIGGVELAAHGDLGVNGARPSLNGLEEVYGNCVIGHNHTAAIQRGVFRVGTMSKLDMGYNRGPSSWTHTNCILYENGQRQLVNFVNGKYYM